MKGEAQDLIWEKKKECRLQCEALEKNIEVLEAHVSEGGNNNLLHQVRLKRQELTELAGQHTWAYSVVSQWCLYDVEDKANKLLAWLDKSDWEQSWVRELGNRE
ncbi:hypothetical protein NDU88_002087 [Pleurodeles waltl]|uniref:Uncharacterized protein n=1 Tax=Pleurodeles waltl TaxID=8319 RepID=A0AAV7T1J3_PLEWA|nr:hypothetical protein NDU88_002087 [Pleurodeles waltl]